MAYNPFYWTRQGMAQGADMGFTPPSTGHVAQAPQNFSRPQSVPSGPAPGMSPTSAQAADTSAAPAGYTPPTSPFATPSKQTKEPHPGEFRHGGRLMWDPNTGEWVPNPAFAGGTSQQGGGTPPPSGDDGGDQGGPPPPSNTWTSGYAYRDPSRPAAPPGTFGQSTAGNARGSIFNPTQDANAFYRALGITNMGQYQPNEFGGGFEAGQDRLRNDIMAGFKNVTGRDLPYQFAGNWFGMGGAQDSQRQPYQMAHWFFGGPERGWYPGIDQATGGYNQAAQDELHRFIEAIRHGEKGTTAPPPGGGGNNDDGTQHT